MRTRPVQGRNSVRTRRWQPLPLTVLFIALGPIVGACSPVDSFDAGGDSEAVDYAACMREHGIDGYPDPVNIDGELTSRLPDDFDLESSDFTAAEKACNSKLAGGESSGQVDQEQLADGLDAALDFAACMRDQGIDFPDPVVEEGGFSGPAGPLDDDADGFNEASEICEEEIGATTTP